MLDVHRGIDIDTRLEQFLHILPALRVTRALHISVSQFIHQNQRRMTFECGIQIKLTQLRALILH